ncbi:predicted protein [Chaetomium globosum CBS 148.51]|uniref:Uncharacterized protein n=1 Tax=Chaetomium globosum (strain ATCC 6205 / CBS 148.51 / DSM 1962 / NBRC 6347 / NRRL 1970) TaxID=306901 RepID=Q2GXD6_CHAGB|nr:uncharacterized protein CHGG_07368 [Chaetomium globosum CBS 148.51]EAQ86115.1 predicted protein [Chaetomium globosum CBS 148.51]
MAFHGAMASDISKLHSLRAVVPERCKPPLPTLSRTFSCIPRTPVTVKDHQPQDGGRRASKRVWFAAFWARCPPVQRPVRRSAVQKASLMPARAMASPLRSMCLANKANGDTGWRSVQRPWPPGTGAEQGREAMVFRNSQSTGSNGSAGKVKVPSPPCAPHHLVAGGARDGPSEAGTARIGESLGEG